MDERIAEVLSALNIICAAAYRNGTQATVIEPQKALIKRLLTAVDTELNERHKMTLDEFQRAVNRTYQPLPLKEGVLFAAVGIAKEMGEVCDIVAKERWHDYSFDKDKFIFELGDVIWYVAAGATAVGVPLSVVAERNKKKLDRRYPDGYDHERCKNRDTNLEEAGFET